MNNSINDSLAQRELESMAQAMNFFRDWWAKILSFFTSYHWKEVIFTAKIISVIISLIFLVLIIMLLIMINVKARIRSSAWQLRESAVFNRKKIEKKWVKIEKKLNTGLEENYKLAVLEADKIFDDILKNLGYEAEVRITNMREINNVRKIKDSIIEDTDFKLEEKNAREILAVYRGGLEDLGVM